MAITLVTNDVDPWGFVANGNSADLSGCETLVSGVTGKRIHVERLVISFGAAINVTIGAGETGGAVTTVLIGPIYGAANSTVNIVFTRPIALAASTALTADASGGGEVTIIVQGYIE
jgi:hypothetical protein